MATTWAILDVHKNPKTHAITVTFQETLDDGRKFPYSITGPPTITKAQVMAELKARVVAARALRDKIDALRASIDSAQIEAYINA